MNRDSTREKDVEALHPDAGDNDKHKNEDSKTAPGSRLLKVSSKGGDSEQKTVSHNPKLSWVLIMGFIGIVFIIMVLALCFKLLDIQDQCHNGTPFEENEHKLFATKTSYSAAYDYLTNSAKNAHTNLLQLMSKQSLSELDAHLRKSGCNASQLHLIMRHGARFPSATNIEELNQNMKKIIGRIDLKKFSSTLQPHQQAQQSDLPHSEVKICFNPLIPYTTWNGLMSPEDGNNLFESGVSETIRIAKRLKQIYPIMFKTNESKIEFGVTSEIRTAQTAIAFMQEIDGDLKLDCRLNQFFLKGVPYNQQVVDELKSKQCYESFKQTNFTRKLEFHKECEGYQKKNVTINYDLNLNSAEWIEDIIKSVSDKLKLVSSDQLTAKEINSMYNICKFETARNGSSIWCNLFTTDELTFLEYLEDLDDYFNQVFAHDNMRKSSCPVTSDLRKDFNNAESNEKSGRPEAKFYFTHSEVIEKLLASSVLQADEDYDVNATRENLKKKNVPKSRRWRTSLLAPFSANLAFSLYQCPKDVEPDPEFFKQSSFKVVASLNERPILLKGCERHICDLKRLQEYGSIFEVRQCKLDEICRDKFIVT